MHFDNLAQRNGYTKLFEWMDELFGEACESLGTTPGFTVQLGQALTQVLVLPLEDDALIAVRAYLDVTAPDQCECYRQLLQLNGTMALGAFGLDDEGDLFIESSLLASSSNPDSVLSAVAAVSLLSESYSGELASRWTV